MPIDKEPGCSKIRQNLPAVAYPAKILGISRCDGPDMPMVTPNIERIATVVEINAESWQNPLNLEKQFYIDGCGTLRTIALRRPIFKQKKGSVTKSLGQNYCSRGSSQSPSRDTVPLSLIYEIKANKHAFLSIHKTFSTKG
jgi:hypothetical protein